VLATCRGTDRRYDARLILGLTEREAETIVERWGCVLRPTEVDGSFPPGTADRLSYRLDMEIEDGRVVRIRGIG
jgi:hypothetical protein